MTEITIPRALLEQALEALEDAADHLPKPNSTECANAADALTASLSQGETAGSESLADEVRAVTDGKLELFYSVVGQAETAEPQPVAWRWKYKFRDIGETGAYEYHSHEFACLANLPCGEPLYACPVAQQPQPTTEGTK